MSNNQLKDNITNVLERVRRKSQKRQLGNSDILVLAVRKTRPAEDVAAAHVCGLSDFGENYLQEALPKITALQALPLVWHYIGPIQSNKTRAIAENFSWVHTVDREKIARRLSEQRPPHLPPLQVCLQVNISNEASKSGIALPELPDLARAVAGLPHLQLRGLMCIPAPEPAGADQRAPFRKMRENLDELRKHYPQMDTLSMGMSADMDAAIDEGATIIRIGTAIFGPRLTGAAARADH